MTPAKRTRGRARHSKTQLRLVLEVAAPLGDEPLHFGYTGVDPPGAIEAVTAARIDTGLGSLLFDDRAVTRSRPEIVAPHGFHRQSAPGFFERLEDAIAAHPAVLAAH